MFESDPINSFVKEQVIRASGLLSLLMTQPSGIGVGIKDLTDGRYQLANKATETLFGKRVEQIAGATDTELFPPEVAAQLHRSDQKIMNGAAATRDEVDFAVNGIPLRCLWLKFPVQESDGRILFIGAMVIDTSRHESFAEMRQTLQRLQQTNQELKKTLVDLDQLASTDSLTGAWNRRRLEDAVINEMDRLRRYDHPLSLLVIDIDYFKKINDDHGHGMGDQVLAELASVLQSSIRTSDSLTRWGGEEFVVLCPNTTLSTVVMLAERLREIVAGSVFPTAGNLTVSIGLAECLPGETWEAWFQRADTALYRAKACGRDQVQIAPERPERIGVGENVAANFVQLVWHKAYECGHEVVDDQHRALFVHANDLLAAILSGRPSDEVSVLIDALISDVIKHFHDEEAIITAAGFPAAADHAAIHRQLVDKAVDLVGRFHAENLGIGELFQFLAHDVIARHMLGADREFFSHLEARR
jgi:diguanylate cyclase (GGDEF)-like protein/hemerythrin-like metal-binding protein